MTRTLAVIGILAAVMSAAQANETTFSTVPANIADAPVKQWRGVERRDKGYAFRWKIRISGGLMWISAIHPGKYWPEAGYSTESRVVKDFKKWGYENIRRVESTAYAGSQWGYMALANRKGRECVVGLVLDSGDFSHDGGQGGNLRGFATDCGSDAASRFDDWLTWFRSFKRVPSGYNATLDK